MTIVLREIDAVAFEEILHFAYTGDVCLTNSNVYSLLTASDFLKLRSSYIENQCIKYITNRSMKAEPMANAIECIMFAHASNKMDFIPALAAHIYKHLNHFLKDPKFMEITYECLDTILKCSEQLSLENGNVILKTINNWVNHSRKARSGYPEKLMNYIDHTKIPPSYLISLMKKYENFLDQVLGSEHSENPTDFNPYADTDDSNIQKSSSLLSSSFHTFFWRQYISVFSKSENSSGWAFSHETPFEATTIRSTVLDGLLYSLSVFNDTGNVQVGFSSNDSVQKIHHKHLKQPPTLRTNKFQICGLGNDIYLHSLSVGRNYHVLAYNRGLDNWSSVPAMKKNLCESFMSTDSVKSLYVLGHESEGFANGNIARVRIPQDMQMYDPRMKMWQKLNSLVLSTYGPYRYKKYPFSYDQYSYIDCCVHQEKIYLANVVNRCIETFVCDLKAGKWSHNAMKLCPYGDGPIRIVSHEKLLWFFSKKGEIVLYDTDKMTSVHDMSLCSTVSKHDENLLQIMDAVVF